jgi:hypothetical protein
VGVGSPGAVGVGVGAFPTLIGATSTTPCTSIPSAAANAVFTYIPGTSDTRTWKCCTRDSPAGITACPLHHITPPDTFGSDSNMPLLLPEMYVNPGGSSSSIDTSTTSPPDALVTVIVYPLVPPGALSGASASFDIVSAPTGGGGVGVAVDVCVAVAVGVGESVRVLVALAVAVGVFDGTGVLVAAGVAVSVGVCVAVAALVAVALGVGVGVSSASTAIAAVSVTPTTSTPLAAPFALFV